MYQSMVDVLIYLYENYMDGEGQPPTDQEVLEDELSQAGFSNSEIHRALRWLDDLAAEVDTPAEHPLSRGAMRIFTDAECTKLDPDVRGLLLSLEQSGILDPVSRELVIDRVLAMDHASVSVEEAKWVALLVLMNQPGREAAFTLMEDLVYNEDLTLVH